MKSFPFLTILFKTKGGVRMIKRLFYVGIALCLCCAPSFAQSSYPTARRTPSYNSTTRTYTTTTGKRNGQYSGQQTGNPAYGNSSRYGNGYSQSTSRYATNGGDQSRVPYTIMTPQCPITQSLVIPATGGYLHTLGCPSVTNSRGTFMYAEDAARRGVRPTGVCPQCRATMQSVQGSGVAQSQEERNAAVRADAMRRLEAQQNRNRVEKQLKEIEDNRRWDNHMAEWENKQPMYIRNSTGVRVNYNTGYTPYAPYYQDDGGRAADSARTRAIINANNEAARTQSENVLRVNGY